MADVVYIAEIVTGIYSVISVLKSPFIMKYFIRNRGMAIRYITDRNTDTDRGSGVTIDSPLTAR